MGKGIQQGRDPCKRNEAPVILSPQGKRKKG